MIRPELINKLFFVLYNWNDCKPLLDNVRVIISATRLMYLCDSEHLFPVKYWKEQQENVISTLPLENRYFQSMYMCKNFVKRDDMPPWSQC